MFSNEAFAQNAEKYMDMVFRVAYGWLKNSDDANDVTQDVLIELYKTDKAFESDAHLKNWLIRVTVNRCKMLFRSQWRRHEDIDDYAETLSFEQPRDGELFKAVMALDKKYRVPLLLFYYEGYTTAEAASMLGIPEKTVSTRLYRARAKLRTILEEEESNDRKREISTRIRAAARLPGHDDGGNEDDRTENETARAAPRRDHRPCGRARAGARQRCLCLGSRWHSAHSAALAQR